ncbi:MAG: type II toxin-antitoxin system Phd/YefM family antitoxin [Candidatus Moranbacteria bacterium]|nr:type II toxin-antitoxin system Phd/YefM family antitoxin [Candidatus Moranbacteria bacterium]
MFPLKNIITITEARKRLFEISDELQRKPGMVYIITVKGKPRTVLMSAKNFEKMRKKLNKKRK